MPIPITAFSMVEEVESVCLLVRSVGGRTEEAGSGVFEVVQEDVVDAVDVVDVVVGADDSVLVVMLVVVVRTRLTLLLAKVLLVDSGSLDPSSSFTLLMYLA